MVIILQTCALSQEQKMMSLCCQVIVILVITTTSQWLPCFFVLGFEAFDEYPAVNLFRASF